jgi:hypothetical protein
MNARSALAIMEAVLLGLASASMASAASPGPAAAVVPTDAPASACPSGPPTLAKIASVPSLWGETSWPPAGSRRVDCFGGSSIAFVARGGMLGAVFPGVRITPAFGQTLVFASAPADEPRWDVNAWLPADVAVSAATRQALGGADPGGSGPLRYYPWYRGSGHFADPGSAQCTPDDGTSTIDDTPVVLTPEQAVEFCQNEFVLDALEWLPVAPTDTATVGVPSSGIDPRPLILAIVAIAALAIRVRRSGPRPTTPTPRRP